MINFLVVAFVIFVMIKAIEQFKRKQTQVAEVTGSVPDTQERLISALERLADQMEAKAQE